MKNYAHVPAIVLSLVATLLVCRDVRADLKLPDVEASGMVLQQETQVSIWGSANPGEAVKVEASWGVKGQTVATSNGQWMVKIKTPAAQALDKGLHAETLTIQGKNTVVLENVLIGEVWLCSGQSNMEMNVGGFGQGGDLFWGEESAKADRPALRLFTVTHATAPLPQTQVQGQWQPSTPTSAALFSAVGYYFGAHLQEHLQIPVGLVQSTWSGTPIEKWMSTQALRSVPEFARAMAAGKGKIAQVTPSTPPDLSILFNGMIAPLDAMAFKGAIWYQGESNVGRADLYLKLFPAMIQDWRNALKNPKLAFYFVQIAPYKYSSNPSISPLAAAELRKSQKTALEVPQTGMAVICDIGDPGNIHPRDKRDVGKRLALQALAKTYQVKGIESDPPQAKDARRQGASVKVTFDCAKDGLMASDGKPLSCFEIAGADGKFAPATAVLDGNVVVVSSPQVAVPKLLTFACGEADIPNLAGKNGLPVGQFTFSVR